MEAKLDGIIFGKAENLERILLLNEKLSVQILSYASSDRLSAAARDFETISNSDHHLTLLHAAQTLKYLRFKGVGILGRTPWVSPITYLAVFVGFWMTSDIQTSGFPDSAKIAEEFSFFSQELIPYYISAFVLGVSTARDISAIKLGRYIKKLKRMAKKSRKALQNLNSEMALKTKDHLKFDGCVKNFRF